MEAAIVKSPGDEPRILPMVPPRGLLESILDEVCAERRGRGLPTCTVTLDVADRHVLQVDPPTIRDVLRALLARALENAQHADAKSDGPAVHEVVVTSIEHADSIEIEIADSGPVSTPAAVIADSKLQGLLDIIGGKLTAASCPEGGSALTVRLPHRRLRRLAA